MLVLGLALGDRPSADRDVCREGELSAFMAATAALAWGGLPVPPEAAVVEAVGTGITNVDVISAAFSAPVVIVGEITGADEEGSRGHEAEARRANGLVSPSPTLSLEGARGLCAGGGGGGLLGDDVDCC